MKERRISPAFRVIKFLVWLFYPKVKIVGTENLPQEPAIVVGNHTKMNGPICSEIYFPGYHYTWCAGEMMHLKEVPDYAFQDFWSQKPLWNRWFFRIASYVIAPLAVIVFNNANTIGVYKDARTLSTFRETLARLQEGANIVIFPEHYEKHNHIVNDFQEGFVDIARMYHRKTRKSLPFVPMYVAPALKKVYIGKPVYFCPDAPIDQERRRICNALMDGITEIACSLPRHTVVPYENLPRKQHVYNK